MAGLWLFFLSVMIPLLVWVIWLAHDLWETRTEPKREAARLAEIVALRRRYVGLNQNEADPSAQELLGDALRSAGHAREALEAFEKALSLGSESPGLEVKIRLTKLELAQNARPGDFGMTLTTREIVCGTCGNLSPPKTRECPHCARPLPVDSMRDVLRHGPLRALVLSDTKALIVQLLVIAIAIGCAFALPDPTMTASILLAALVVGLFLALRRLGNPG